MSEVKSVADLKHSHIGKTLRVQGLDGGYIEGTLAGIRHRVLRPYKPHVRTWLSFEEFSYPVKGSDEQGYVWFETYENREAKEIEE